MIGFHEEGGQPPPHPEEELVQWIDAVTTARGGKLGEVNYIFCSDDYLLVMNREYLHHDTLTDIITFPYGEFPDVSGDIFISTERVAENAREFGESYTDELHRVLIHGVLHLCGQEDKSPKEARDMRNLEQWALGLRPVSLLPSPAARRS